MFYFCSVYYWLLCIFRMECLVCKHVYARLGNYLRHLSAEHPEVDTELIRTETKLKESHATPIKPQNECVTCHKICSSRHKLNLHLRTHLDTLAFPCTLCGGRFTTRTQLRLHKEGTHSKGTFHCSQCDKICFNKLALNRHNKMHEEGVKREHTCTNCGKTHLSATSLKSHLVTHSVDKPYPCKECELTFSRISGLSSHSKLHSGNKEFCCSVCSDMFVTRNSLRNHQICHSQERPYSCPECDKTFSRKGDLNVHKRRHTNTRLFKCDICDKSFLRSSHLNSHQKIHTRKLVCHKCGNSFESNQFSEFCKHRDSCKLKAFEKDFLPPDLSQLTDYRFSPISFYSEDNQLEELYTESQQFSLMSHTANEAVTQALKSMVHTPDIYDSPFSQHFPFHSYQHSDLATNQFDEFIFPPNMHILGSGFDVSVRGVSSSDVITPLIGSYFTN